MDPGIPASSIILLDLGYPNLVALLSPDLKVKENECQGLERGLKRKNLQYVAVNIYARKV